jgi:hypothetical protein
VKNASSYKCRNNMKPKRVRALQAGMQAGMQARQARQTHAKTMMQSSELSCISCVAPLSQARTW